MRGPDSDPLGPEIAGALMAVDATLAGDPVDPEYAELAELALILRRERPRTSDVFTARLDEQVERRFARPAQAARGTGLRRWLGGSMAGLAAAAAATVLVIAISNGGHGLSNSSSSAAGGTTSATVASSASAASTTSASAGVAAGSGSSGNFSGAAKSAAPTERRSLSSSDHAKGSAGGATQGVSAASAPSAATASTPSLGVIPSPPIPGKRQVVQSAQISLTAPAAKIDDVAQQIFDVVGQEKGYVNSSNVTSTDSPGAGGYFLLSVPSVNLAATLGDLSHLRGAHVTARTDQTNDITAQVGGAGQKLAEARALRRSLLKQLANATTSQQVSSIQAQLHDANASIASDLSTLRGLQRQVAYSKIQVNLESAGAPPVVHHHSSGFTISKAAHDAGRVLVVVAGVGLIVLAVLVPVALVAALLAWVGIAIRRRRRDHALDIV